ncbi:MAG: UDP-glucose 4-epimerase GalE [Bacilli bacterium]|nr:UDP-glucose 4-epimerase GalE [Bacilli bacterium]MDD3305248.1 UDP-glucose 4-epimerase GalE [Bacilli bacterium]MDD4053971.1 UDP-glucose 4-epimerase GalE [Bacilli bacterium]MDD4411437.1 UDP-glucose 4-epimerase GalE [Bacilli bacterium]
MKVLVIGGAGYIGSHAVCKLLKSNNEVVIMDNLSTGRESSINNKAKFYLGDITQKDDLIKVFREECSIKPFDVVMHFAAKLLVNESVEHPLEYYHNNVEGVRLMLETMTEFGIKNIVFSSTAAVYGNPTKEECSEDDTLLPVNPYGETKLTCEKMIKWVSNTYGINYGIFRYFNVAGADESLEIGYNYERKIITHLIPIVAEVALGIREKLMVYGDDYETKDGTCIRDYVHVSDLANAHVLGANYLLAENKSFIINLGSNDGYSVKEIIEAAEKIYPIKYEMSKRREGDPAKLIASNNKAKELLGWGPKYDLFDIINSDIEYRKRLVKK